MTLVSLVTLVGCQFIPPVSQNKHSLFFACPQQIAHNRHMLCSGGVCIPRARLRTNCIRGRQYVTLYEQHVFLFAMWELGDYIMSLLDRDMLFCKTRAFYTLLKYPGISLLLPQLSRSLCVELEQKLFKKFICHPVYSLV